MPKFIVSFERPVEYIESGTIGVTADDEEHAELIAKELTAESYIAADEWDIHDAEVGFVSGPITITNVERL